MSDHAHLDTTILRALLAAARRPGNYLWNTYDRMGIETGVDLTPEQAERVEQILADLETSDHAADPPPPLPWQRALVALMKRLGPGEPHPPRPHAPRQKARHRAPRRHHRRRRLTSSDPPATT